MILHADFAAEEPRIMVEKPWIMVENRGLWLKTVDYGKKTVDLVKTTDFAVSEFKITKLFISFQSRERIQRVSIFLLFTFFWGV